MNSTERIISHHPLAMDNICVHTFPCHYVHTYNLQAMHYFWLIDVFISSHKQFAEKE